MLLASQAPDTPQRPVYNSLGGGHALGFRCPTLIISTSMSQVHQVSNNYNSVPAQETHVDVLIIGAGPAGVMAANALNGAGVNVKIIDNK